MSTLQPSFFWGPGEIAGGLVRLRGGQMEPLTSMRTSTSIAESLEILDSVSGLETVPLNCAADQVVECIAQAAPMVLPVADSEAALLVVRASRHTVTLLAQDGAQRTLSMSALLERLTPPLSAEVEDTIKRLERDVGAAVARSFREERLRKQRTFVGWQVPVEVSSSLWNRQNLLGVAGLIGVHALHFGLWVLSWITLIGALLSVGEREALLSVWMVALISALLLLPVESLLQQRLAVRLGIDIKQNLLRAALGLDKAAVRSEGIGQLTARALEANRLDELATQGGLRVLLSAFDAMAMVLLFILFAGIHPLLLLFLLTGVLAARAWMVFYRTQTRLHAAELQLTAVHTEEMIGHRTRKVFLGREQWHAAEESCLYAYESACAEADKAELRIGMVPRLWAVFGVVVVLLDQFGQGASTLTSVAMIGFVIVGFGILHGASAGIMKLLKALVSARYVDALERTPEATQSPVDTVADPDGGAHLVVQGLEYVYPDSSRQVLQDVNLELGATDKLLMTGDSGSGKSTFGALLAGRLQPSSGTVLSQGVDRHVVGSRGWLKQVCYLPQPGSNHVLTDTFAFNLLLGRNWPPTQADLQEAQSVAESLGLGPLIEKMPAGMMQMVGEGGWRLSQGEQARLFLARGILQGSRLLVVDELLAPLDPVTGLEVLKVVEDLPSQLVLIAHT